MRSEYFVGLDLGQSLDPTALAVLEKAERQGDWDAVAYGYRTVQSLQLRHLERIPLGTSYPNVVERVAQVMQSRALANGRRHLIVDATGVGRPVVDLLRKERMDCRIEPATITSGNAEGMSGGYHRVPKRDLIVGLQVLLQNGE